MTRPDEDHTDPVPAELERARRVVVDAYDLASRRDLDGALGVLRGEMERMERAA